MTFLRTKKFLVQRLNCRKLSSKFQAFLVSGVSGALALTVYLLTLAPSLTWAHWGADGGDFITAAVTGRLPHPPGFPFYMLLARMMLWLPGDPARALNALSAGMAALAVMALAWIALRRGAGPVMAAALALTVGFAPLFWSQSLITEVHAAAAACVALTLVAVEARSAFGAGLGWGLALAVHPTTIFLAPWLLGRGADAPRRAFLDAPRGASAPRQTRQSWGTDVPCRAYVQAYVQFVVGLALGLSLYALPLLRGAGPEPWGDARTLAGWLEFSTARLYWGYAFALPLVEWPGRIVAWAALLARQFTPVGALLVLYGLTRWARRAPGEVLGWLAAWGALNVYAIGYATHDSLVYLVGLLPLMIYPLVEGARGMMVFITEAQSSRRFFAICHLPFLRASVVIVLLPLALLALNWGALDLSRDTEAAMWARTTLAQAPPEAVVLVAGDRHTFALWYAQDALALRPDVLLISRNFWSQPAYREFLAQHAGVTVAEPEEFAGVRPLCEVEEEVLRCQ